MYYTTEPLTAYGKQHASGTKMQDGKSRRRAGKAAEKRDRHDCAGTHEESVRCHARAGPEGRVPCGVALHTRPAHGIAARFLRPVHLHITER